MILGCQTYFREPAYTHFSQLPPAPLFTSLLDGKYCSLGSEIRTLGSLSVSGAFYNLSQVAEDVRDTPIQLETARAAHHYRPNAHRQESPQRKVKGFLAMPVLKAV